jgi:hypothetical protein
VIIRQLQADQCTTPHQPTNARGLPLHISVGTRATQRVVFKRQPILAAHAIGEAQARWTAHGGSAAVAHERPIVVAIERRTAATVQTLFAHTTAGTNPRQ